MVRRQIMTRNGPKQAFLGPDDHGPNLPFSGLDAKSTLDHEGPWFKVDFGPRILSRAR
jgi:hypothetical protein